MYDFRLLSPSDFEHLCRDLLQEQFSTRLESFSPGADFGIDLRGMIGHKSVVVQCKHYVGSGFTRLLNDLKARERSKVESLQPDRYILMTSVPLTVQKKQRVLDVLQPYCQQTSDVYGSEDLNALLDQYPEVEQRHFKLWLTSTGVLQRVLNAGIFRDSENHVDHIRTRLARYVPNDSLDRARSALTNNHFCIIAGIPGIGKTTLAEVLLAEYVDRHSFQPFRILHDITEIRPVMNRKVKQVFYFDDFLGRTQLIDLRRNEDKRFVELMRDVKDNPNWRFILTTREYIFNSAVHRYEAFAYPEIGLRKCTIDLSDYTRRIRAQILYNHIFFSDLPRPHKLALLENEAYTGILRHPNYNPRVVQYMTDEHRLRGTLATCYRQRFIDNLDDPSSIWEHAYSNQISRASRHLLLVLATLPEPALLDDVKDAFWSFYLFRRKNFGFPVEPEDFKTALRELDGTFVQTGRKQRDITVTLHSAAVKDYIEKHLRESQDDVVHLMQSAKFYNQLRFLWHRDRTREVASANDEFLDLFRQLAHSMDMPVVHSYIYVPYYGGFRVERQPMAASLEDRAHFLLEVADQHPSQTIESIIAKVLQELEQRWTSGDGIRWDLLRLVQRLANRGLSEHDPLFTGAKTCLLSEGETIDDYVSAVDFYGAYPSSVSDDEYRELEDNFRGFLEGVDPDFTDDGPEGLRDLASKIESVGEQLAVDVEGTVAELEASADAMEREDEDEYVPANRATWGPAAGEEEDEKALFGKLRSHLLNS